jgi:hypothetical protein
MSPEVIQRCMDARPFQPFYVLLTDHSELTIAKAADAELTSDRLALQVTYRDERIFVALNQIVSVKIESRPSGTFGFGS